MPHIKHSIIDPFTDAIQISGRIRTGFKSITHITKLFLYRDELTDNQIEEEVDFHMKLVNRILQMGLAYKNPAVQSVVDALVDNNFCSSLLNEEYSFNTYSLDAIKYKLKVENYYSTPLTLKEAYLSTNYFNVKLVKVSHISSEEDQLKILKARGKKKRKLIYRRLCELVYGYLNNNKPLDDDFQEDLNDLKKRDEFLFDLFSKADQQEIEDTDFILTKMKKLYFDKTLEERESNLSNMIDEILVEFKLNTRLYSKDIKAKLQKIYDKNSYSKNPSEPYRAKAGDILNYFEGKYIEPKKPSPKRGYETYYILTSKKYSFSKDLKLLNDDK